MSPLRLFSRVFPGPWQLAVGVSLVALALATVGFVLGDFTPMAFIVPAAFLVIAGAKRSESK